MDFSAILSTWTVRSAIGDKERENRSSPSLHSEKLTTSYLPATKGHFTLNFTMNESLKFRSRFSVTYIPPCDFAFSSSSAGDARKSNVLGDTASCQLVVFMVFKEIVHIRQNARSHLSHNSLVRMSTEHCRRTILRTFERVFDVMTREVH